jgi:hypothetical protein
MSSGIIINSLFLKIKKPIEDILGGDFLMKRYDEIVDEDLKKCDKVVICGTSLADNKFVEDTYIFDFNLDSIVVVGIVGDNMVDQCIVEFVLCYSYYIVWPCI